MNHIDNKHSVKNHQKGMALVMALIMLLLITVLGVSAVRMSNSGTQVAGNSIYSILVFQGAESALGRSASSKDWSNIPAAAAQHGPAVPVPASYFTPAEVVTGGGILNSSGSIAYDGELSPPPYNTTPNSTGFTYHVFRVSAQSSLATTAARDRHTQGVAAPIANP